MLWFHIIDGGATSSLNTSFLIFVFHPIGGSGWSSLSTHSSICLRLTSLLCWLTVHAAVLQNHSLKEPGLRKKKMPPSPLFTRKNQKEYLPRLSQRHYFCSSFPIPIIKKGILSAKSCWLFSEFLEAKWPRHLQQIMSNTGLQFVWTTAHKYIKGNHIISRRVWNMKNRENTWLSKEIAYPAPVVTHLRD